MAFSEGDRVKWNWGNGQGEGVVVEIHTSRVEKTIKGVELVRNADGHNPAYLIRQDDGDEVLKSESEIEFA